MRTRSTTSFSMSTLRALPVAVIDPGDQVQVIGARITLSGMNSYASEEEEIETWTWRLVGIPLGSVLGEDETLDVDGDGSVVSFAPDVTGQYTLELVVATAYRSSAAAQATVNIQAVLVPYLGHVTPSGNFMFAVLGDFWSLVDNRQALPVLWSGYTQAVASDLLRLWQVDYAKSIRDIQPLFQRRWLPYSPEVLLGDVTGVFGHHQSGDGAFTGSALGACVGVVISASEFVLFSGRVSERAIGTDLRVYTGGNVGTYVVRKLNADNSGYLVSTSTPFPASDVLDVGADIVSIQLSDIVYSVATDFAAAGVSIGDVLRIETGSDSGYYSVVAVGIAGGLLNDNTLRLDTSLARTASGLTYTLFAGVRASVAYTATPLTDTVFIPEGEADFSLFQSSGTAGSGTLNTSAEILVEKRHVYASMVGKSVTVTSGVNTGRSFVVSSVNTSGTGYLTASAFSGTFAQAVTYSLPILADITSRLLIFDGRAYKLLSAVLDESLPSVVDGGRGPLWVLTLAKALAPSGLEGKEWRVAASLTSTDTDFEALGVCAGDLLTVALTRDDNQLTANIPCIVLGAVGGMLAFDLGTLPLDATTNGELSTEQLLTLGQELQLPRIFKDELDVLQIASIAQILQTLWDSTAFRRAYYNLIVESGDAIPTDFFDLVVRPVSLRRNSRISVDDTVASVPALFEYIEEPIVGEVEDGTVLITKDDVQTLLAQPPVILLGNKHYTVQSEEMKGVGAETAVDSELIRIPSGALTSRDVLAGDVIALTSGFDQRTYAILEVRDAETLRVMSEDGLPAHEATSVRYTITRRTLGAFLRFVPGTFTADAPSPKSLWAETTFFDNSEYIEDNFGLLVALTQEDFNAYGGAQVTYKGAVTALMYAWASGPTLGNAALGTHVLLGLPVTEVGGVVLEVDNAYRTDQGRVLVEDTDAEGVGTGVVRSYFYAQNSDETLDLFEGIAVNPRTGVSYVKGDTVDAFHPLTRSVALFDYVKSPGWWQEAQTLRGRELEKLHTWALVVDAGAIDSRDMALVVDFAQAIRPIYTKPEVILLLYLLDVLTMNENLVLEGTIHNFDDIAFSLESTHMVDDYNGGSLPLRQVGIGSFASRTLFEGHDLEMTLGSDTVISERGGFQIPLGALPNPSFPALATRGAFLVREANDSRGLAGDVLFVQEGLNEGRFEVLERVSDTELRVRQLGVGPSLLPTMGPDSPDPVTMQAETGVRFWVERLNQNPLCVGTTLLFASSDQFEDPDAFYMTDGVTVDDVLVVETGAFKGRYRITEVFGNTSTLEATNLQFTPSFPAGVNYVADYRIERLALQSNPIAVTGAGSTVLGSTNIGFPDLYLSSARTGDTVVIVNGADAGAYTLIAVLGDVGVLNVPMTANTASLDVYVERQSLDLLPDSDSYYERFAPNDQMEMEILRPTSVFLSLADGTLVAATGTASSATGFAGVTLDMRLQITTGDSSGVFALLTVAANDAVIDGLFFENSAGPETFDILEDVADFNVNGDTVDSVALTDFEAMGVLPGDVFSFVEGEFVIETVATSTLTLVITTGVGPLAYTGVILRRSLSL